MQQSQSHFFYLAPILGVTDALFRTIYHSHFPFFDAAVAPFINPQRFANFKDKLLADILPENNTGNLPVIPQLLYNTAEDFIVLGKRLQNLGYAHLNWNLGCPSPMVAGKQRGSGLLPHPERIIEILEAVRAELSAEISVKTRLGYEHAGDLEKLLPLLEEFALKEIIIHPRIGKQLYRGHADPDGFERCRALTSHSLVYNGDILTPLDFEQLSRRFPEVDRWMIGRGALADPFLLADIRGILIPPEQKKKKIREFHDDLYDQLQTRHNGPGHLLSKMKQIWAYLIKSFPENEKMLKKIRKASTEHKYLQILETLWGK
ncbi:tRNA dihydrouridine synthase [Desulfopila inferna]|uniref:tRNA dihydrouridine synthase n=1 Tax=Desulfopila inferna TaxID=468528 RepID=UPI001963DAD9|nr:tRNA-dihydrouridine synthase family protein [Desulfopila inferna]MBM9604425.1 tRNA-dihydrouridine synthase family protein [Desulfopila inferna]